MDALAPAPNRPTLDLSGPRLRMALEVLIKASEPIGGVERFAEALKLKSQAFQQRLAEGRAASLDRADFDAIAPLMATVRRRIVPLIDHVGWREVRSALAELLRDAHVPGTADARIAAFEGALSSPSPLKRSAEGRGRGEGQEQPLRFLRDLAAEVLHNVYPEHHPLMTRWVWDSKSNTGVLREVWHGDDLDRRVIDVPDRHETFLVLREELSQFLSDNGIFRDMIWYVDLLKAQVYAGYISEQGGAYLKADFVHEGDPLEHTRRILGLDRVGKRGRTLKGEAHDVATIKRLS